ncbi:MULTISPECIES: RPA family protein [unclassified Methanosarcina]|uniref:RPA family protein n=1 Tax=unclassified Methanosarcina TaxID=2644672 RepID=UPI00061617CC|nr:MULTISPECIES: RPA family protein [unclassified Methanosarcina]AKB19176.1 Glycerol dehydrogenase [Methanosarcina sp. WWM596]AKB22995.1 Glycerol dehydrogenase [Methanosarcina sp. WH1]
MLKREIAKRIFAKEFEACRELEKSARSSSEIVDSKSPNLLISPLGLILNRVFAVGVLTELDSIGTQNEMWKARIVDPTGAFTVYAGQYQPDASIFFSTVQVPAFIALTGKARIYEPEPGSVFISIRAEEANVVDEEIRNRWVVDTAEQTVDRLEAFSDALASGYHGETLREYLLERGISEELAEGISIALERDRAPQEFARQLSAYIREGLKALNFESEGPAGAKADQKEFVLELLKEIGGGRGVDYATFVDSAVSRGVPEEFVEEVVRSLLAGGQCYEPKIGIIRLVG